VGDGVAGPAGTCEVGTGVGVVVGNVVGAVVGAVVGIALHRCAGCKAITRP